MQLTMGTYVASLIGSHGDERSGRRNGHRGPARCAASTCPRNWTGRQGSWRAYLGIYVRANVHADAPSAPAKRHSGKPK
jgi:hypothetical protein